MVRYFLFLFLSFYFSHAQVGIETTDVDTSAALEIDTDQFPAGSKKGFLGPRVQLTGSLDITTIPDPALGLLVYNIGTAGTFPDNVLADRFYFWNGSQWVDLGLTSVLQNYFANRIISMNSSSVQTFAISGSTNNINATSGTNGGIVVTFDDADVVLNTGNAVTKIGNTLRIDITGFYEVTAFVNYNPNRGNITTTGCYINIKLQRSTDGGVTWTDFIGNRTAWGGRVANLIKTSPLLSTPVRLTAGQRIRLVIQNPFTSTEESHGQGTNLPAIITSVKAPVSKSLTLTLLDYDLQ